MGVLVTSVWTQQLQDPLQREEQKTRYISEVVVIASKVSNLCTILDLTKKFFRGISCQILATKSDVVDFQHGRHGLAIDAWEFIKNVSNYHSCVPSPESGIVQHFKCIIDACIKCHVAGTLDVPHQQKNSVSDNWMLCRWWPALSWLVGLDPAVALPRLGSHIWH